MRYAIFSDIHGEVKALQAILADMAGRAVEAYLCLGDICSEPCIEIVRNLGAETVFGNWEALINPLAPAAQRPWLDNLPPLRRFETFWVSHASPTWPATINSLEQYLAQSQELYQEVDFPLYLAPSPELEQAFATLVAAGIPLLFHGHTHRQTVWTLTLDHDLLTEDANPLFLKPAQTYIIGVGSVGQPQDSSKPSYAIFDAEARVVEFVQLAEDIETLAVE